MSDALPEPSVVELLETRRLRLVEAAAPRIPPEEQAAVNRAWDEAVRANPTLFDGPAVSCAGLARDDPDGLVITWARTTYRLHALRRVPGATVWLPSLFVSVVQPSDDGRLLVVRMSPWTAAPGRWQLPGGSAEPPEDGGLLDTAALRRHATRELAEEIGVDTAPGDLTLWLVTRGEDGSAGVLFLAPPRPASFLRERFADLVESETALGRDPELDRIALVHSPAELARLSGPHVDHLEPVVRRYAAQRS
ncbi:NUDIX hydrolase [Microbispora catharanthi]|uniref:NUDIX hydrolase n=1 Tax=Microbispora catharanthi TaxID=1712871 RepID=UPI00197B2ECA|nr:NUDIX domain-containing protein [Microbispora catharanthi]